MSDDRGLRLEETSLWEKYVGRFTESFRREILENHTITIDSVYEVLKKNPDIARDVKESKWVQGFLRESKGVFKREIVDTQCVLMTCNAFGYNIDTGDLNLYRWYDGKNIYDVYETMGRLRSGRYATERYDFKSNVYDNDLHYKIVFTDVKGSKVDRRVLIDKFIFFPYLYVSSAMDAIRSLVEEGYTFLVTLHYPNGSLKSRYITENVELLKKYCDDPSAVEGLKSKYFYPMAHFYAPVLGAPSTTAMMTRVDVAFIESIVPVKAEDIKGVEKPVNPRKMVCEKNAVIDEIIAKGLQKSDLMELPRFSESYTLDGISKVALSGYIDILKAKELDEVALKLGVYDKAEKKWKILSGTNEVIDLNTVKSNEDLRKLLSRGVYVINTQGKDGKYSSCTVTNDTSILRELYGDDYFKKYEGFNAKWWRMLLMLSQGRSAGEALDYCGFPNDDDIADAIESLYRDGFLEGDNGEAYKMSMAEAMGYKLKEPSDTDSVLCRSCYATYDEARKVPSGYYRYLYATKILKILKIR